MKRFLLCLLIISFAFRADSQTSYKIPANVKKILFLGNSITYAGQYVTDIEAYLTIRYPERKFEIINVGLPSETVSGLSEDGHADGKFPRPDLHERLSRVLAQTKPDLVFASYGMNDGIYLPFDDSRFEKFKAGITWLHDEVIKSGAAIIHLTPPLFDERKDPVYANVLDLYSDWLISCRYTKHWTVADMHFPMKKDLENRRLIDTAYVYAKDGVHPNEAGHWIMAKSILLFLGENGIANAENIKAAISSNSNGEHILKLIDQRQVMMKDAWLTSTGHKRPGMKTGLPLDQATLKASEIENQIRALIKQ